MACCAPRCPSEYGGGGGDFGHAAVLAEEIGRAAASAGVGFGLHSDIIAPYIHRLGTEEQKRSGCPRCARARSSWPSR